jgi:hypothetical protein
MRLESAGHIFFNIVIQAVSLIEFMFSENASAILHANLAKSFQMRRPNLRLGAVTSLTIIAYHM